MIEMIKVSNIFPHPDNPRNDLGDLTELANSIKASGILQNLTVVPRSQCGVDNDEKEDSEKFYTVIIGHRRLAAAKLVGLTEVPCVISEMSKNEQIATMLSENMQRSDLTFYEQAQGFQLMFDMGGNIEEISDKTGFSSSTIRRRIKLLDLDKDEFAKSCERGATLDDYIKLDKLKSTERKNNVLKFIGTSDFAFKLKQAINEEITEEKKQQLINILDKFAIRLPENQKQNYTITKYIHISIWNGEFEVPDDSETVQYYYYIEPYGYIYLMTEQHKPEEAQPPQKSEEELRREATIEKFNAIAKNAYECRYEFIKNINNIKKYNDVLIKYAVKLIYYSYIDFRVDRIIDLFELSEEEKNECGYVYNEREWCAEIDIDRLISLEKINTEKLLLAILFTAVSEDDSTCHSRYSGEYRENELIIQIYNFLNELGYEASEEEMKYILGEHELFGVAEAD